MMHFGLRKISSKEWFVLSSGEVFWTTSRAVADAQLARLMRWEIEDCGSFTVEEFESPTGLQQPTPEGTE